MGCTREREREIEIEIWGIQASLFALRTVPVSKITVAAL